MDNEVAQLLLGLFTNGLYDALKQISLRDGSSSLPDPSVRRSVEQAVRTGVDELTDVLPAPEIGGEAFIRLLRSPEISVLLREVFLAETIADGSALAASRERFGVLVDLHLPDLVDRDAHVNRIFLALVGVAEKTLQAQLSEGSIAAHDAASALRFQWTKDQLNNIAASLEVLRRNSREDLEAILAFEEEYRRAVARAEGVVAPPSLDRNQTVAVDRLYVPARITSLRSAYSGVDNPDRHDSSEVWQDYGAFINTLGRAVVLGDPGGGKSTLTKKLAYDLAKPDPVRLRGRRLTPIRIELRRYGADKIRHNVSIVEYMATVARTHYQFGRVPEFFFEYLLQNGRALVIFDGLDELLDTSDRQDIRDDVAAFGSLFPSTEILVTSRAVGYDEARLDPDDFPIRFLGPFTVEQTAEYARKWFTFESLADVEIDSRVAAFMHDSETITDLRANPLLLGLITSLYTLDGYIPENRPAVYRKCAVLLFERWDKQRKIQSPLPFESFLRPTMQMLAHWFYTNAAIASEGASREQLVEKTADYLHPRRFATREEAEEKAREFVDLCKGRAWVFTDVGSTDTNEPLYQFTHATFREFFTAEYLTRTHPTAEALVDVLSEHIAAGEWDVVAQLALQIQAEQVEDSANVFLERLLDAVDNTRRGRHLLSFCVRSVAFVVPSPEVIERLVTLATAATVEMIVQDAHEPDSPSSEPSIYEQPLPVVCGAASEIAADVAESAVRRLYAGIRETTGAAQRVTLKLLMHSANAPRPSLWEPSRGVALTDLQDVVSDWASRDPEVAQFAIEHDLGLPLADFVTNFGPEEVFVPRAYETQLSTWGLPLAGALIWRLRRGHNVATGEQLLEQLGQQFQNTTFPLTVRDIPPGLTLCDWIFGDPLRGRGADSNYLADASTLARWSALIVAAVSSEIDVLHSQFEGDLLKSIAPNSFVAPLLRARADSELESSHSADWIRAHSVRDEDAALLDAWIRGGSLVTLPEEA